ncbi:hypothetical protein GT347_09635 [Xylophilus rhododendri]|uniref:Uncharacterized protein n=1 Tax=Xylophilus rhododendri TaxID=2697032 RepID=A0A857J2R9_9BURK|nr:hypothetical protein [Xylophilus rhododendri]QHI98230.1 hypothetical protein GT347_09635 [Xylophilus rhododendri]
MSDFFKIALSTAFFWLITFGIVFAHEYAGQSRCLSTKLVNATLLSVLLTVPVFLLVCHAVLFLCPGCRA